KARELFKQTVAAGYNDSYFYYTKCNTDNKDVFLRYIKLSVNDYNIADAQYYYGKLLDDGDKLVQDKKLGLYYIGKSKKQKISTQKNLWTNSKPRLLQQLVTIRNIKKKQKVKRSILQTQTSDMPSLKEIVLNDSNANDVSVINCPIICNLSILCTRLSSLKIEKCSEIKS
ncbi:15683_t:CDS:2, partial [Gigaspora margarita]